MIHNLPHSVARVLALAEIQHNPDEPYDDFTFGGHDVGLPDDEYIVIKYYRKRYKDATRKTEPSISAVMTPVMAYE